MQLAIYSEADRLQPHRFKADESYQVGAAPVMHSLRTAVGWPVHKLL